MGEQALLQMRSPLLLVGLAERLRRLSGELA